MSQPEQIVIAGAGPVGAVCALALKAGGLDPLVLEARPENAPVNDRRTLALSYGSRLLLQRLGIWARIEDATPITRIHISHRGGLGRACLSAQEEKLPALGYVLSYGELAQALMNEIRQAGVRMRFGAQVQKAEAQNGAAELTLAGEAAETLHAQLAVIADGGRGKDTPPAKWSRDYAQVAVVAEVKSELPHGNLAYERFTPNGPIALLPRGEGYALVWVNAPEEAARIAQLDDAEFLAELHRQFGNRQGRFLAVHARGRFPLKLDYRGTEAGPHVVRIGNASQTLHPVAGQGFNLGLRDAWELAESCLEARLDMIGSAAQLSRYAAGRRRDALPGIGFTDFLVRAFSTTNPIAHHLRGLGLMALQALPPARHFVARRMLFGKNG
ncbi:MAG: FAD-dependent monooxygenase [Pseudomonadota bacterium]